MCLKIIKNFCMLQVRRKPLNHSLSATAKLQKTFTDGKPSSNGSRQAKVPEMINGASSRQVIISRVYPEKTTKKPQVPIPLIELD